MWAGVEKQCQGWCSVRRNKAGWEVLVQLGVISSRSYQLGAPNFFLDYLISKQLALLMQVPNSWNVTWDLFLGSSYNLDTFWAPVLPSAWCHIPQSSYCNPDFLVKLFQEPLKNIGAHSPPLPPRLWGNCQYSLPLPRWFCGATRVNNRRLCLRLGMNNSPAVLLSQLMVRY